MGDSQNLTDLEPIDSHSNGSVHESSPIGNEIVIPSDGELSDDMPTVISQSSNGNAALTEKLSNELRGRTLAHFKLIEPIGVGGMAAVIKARDQNLDRFVALKILPPEMATDPENVKRFHQEARSAAKLDHANIAHVYYCGQDKGLHFIGYEYVEGSNLMSLLKQHGPLQVPKAIQYMLDITAALSHASKHGVVHRDVKPSNIIIDQNDRAKLVDMGLARILETQKDHGLTHSGVTLGTFDYISPEQALEPRDADARSDIYSLGCTFYHMLTGQGPVPDGTAAKKLRFHQHEAPLDPREINPTIPDSVAAILAKMMAKNVEERYQHPDHLIQHLVHVAQQYSPAPTRTQPSMLAVPLPHQPRKRPLLWVSAAGIALCIVLLVLSFFPVHLDPSPDLQLSNNRNTQEPNSKTKNKTGGGLPVGPNQINSDTIEINNTKEDLQKLQQVFASSRSRHVVKIRDALDMSDLNLVFHGKGRTLVVKSSDEQEQRTIRLKYQTASNAGGIWAGMIIDGGSVLFRNLRFELESNVTPLHIVAAIAVKNGAKVTFDRCTFVQMGFPKRALLDELSRELFPLASIAMDHTSADDFAPVPQIILQRCYFQTGQTAIALRGTGGIQASNCAFGQHSALFHLSGQVKQFGSQITMQACSAHVVRGPVFRLDDQASTRLTISRSIFAQPADISLNQGDPRDFIHQRDANQPMVLFKGERNAYYNLNSFWVWPRKDSAPMILAKFEDFKEQVTSLKGQVGVTSSVLEKIETPWANASAHNEIRTASFLLHRFRRQVRRLDKMKETTFGIGVQDCAWGPVPNDLPPLSMTIGPVAAKNEIVVDPIGDEKDPNTFTDLNQAIAKVRNRIGNHVILIKEGSKTDRTVRVENIALKKAGVTILLKPYGSERPLLTLAETVENDAALFYVSEGKLILEDLEFELHPKAMRSSESVVKLGVNGGQAELRNCVITLKEGNQVPLSLVALRNPKGVMKMGPQPIPPQIVMRQCFVRGEGDLLRSDTGQPFLLDIEESLIGLSGSIINVNSGTSTKYESAMKVRLAKVTAFCSKPFFYLHGSKSAKFYLPTRLESMQDCLFHTVNDEPLLYLEGFDFADEPSKLAQVIQSKKAYHNAYCNMETMLIHDIEQGAVPTEWNQKDWLDWSKELQSVFPAARFNTIVGRPFSETFLNDYQVKEVDDIQLNQLKQFGAPENQVPGPSQKVMPSRLMPSE